MTMHKRNMGSMFNTLVLEFDNLNKTIFLFIVFKQLITEYFIK